ncbi:NifU family protein [bacterium]|nr:NifU family protein [bacterium]MCP5462860.1 NifU family protein [bacterium]
MAISKEAVQTVLNKIRPFLQADGGDCELVNITADNVVQLRLVGACGTCPSAIMTMKLGIEREMRKAIPEVTSVESV